MAIMPKEMDVIMPTQELLAKRSAGETQPAPHAVLTFGAVVNIGDGRLPVRERGQPVLAPEDAP